MSRKSILLLIGAVILIGGFYYWYSNGTPGVAGGSDAQTKRDPDQFEPTLATFRILKGMNFDESLFREPAFLALQKPDIPAPPAVTPGRLNPFLPAIRTKPSR